MKRNMDWLGDPDWMLCPFALLVKHNYRLTSVGFESERTLGERGQTREAAREELWRMRFEAEACACWLSETFERRQAPNPDATSFVLQQLYLDATCINLPEGAVIAAAMRSGFDWDEIKHDCGAMFGIKQRCLAREVEERGVTQLQRPEPLRLIEGRRG